jgi:hypothetical protein
VATLTEAQAAQAAALVAAYKAQQNREAARMAAIVALYYKQRVDPSSLESVEDWLQVVIPRLIRTSDEGSNSAALFFQALRRIEVGSTAPAFTPQATLGVIDPGVRKSLLAVGPYDYMNKASQIETLKVGPQQKKAMLAEAKQATTTKLAGAAIRHAQAGSRQTIHDNVERDRTALGYVRVTKDEPCFFCAMLASRGLRYRAFKEDSFDLSNQRFTGDGDAKVHDNCGCSLKPVYANNDPLVKKTDAFADMWSRWGAGGGRVNDAALRFRRGYEHWRDTGEYLSHDEASAA